MVSASLYLALHSGQSLRFNSQQTKNLSVSASRTFPSVLSAEQLPQQPHQGQPAMESREPAPFFPDDFEWQQGLLSPQVTPSEVLLASLNVEQCAATIAHAESKRIEGTPLYEDDVHNWMNPHLHSARRALAKLVGSSQQELAYLKHLSSFSQTLPKELRLHVEPYLECDNCGVTQVSYETHTDVIHQIALYAYCPCGNLLSVHIHQLGWKNTTCRVGEALKPGPFVCFFCEEKFEYEAKVCEGKEYCADCLKRVLRAQDVLISKKSLMEALDGSQKILEDLEKSPDRSPEQTKKILDAKHNYQKNFSQLTLFNQLKKKGLLNTHGDILSQEQFNLAASEFNQMKAQDAARKERQAQREAQKEAETKPGKDEKDEEIHVPTATGDIRAPIPRQMYDVDDLGTQKFLIQPIVTEIVANLTFYVKPDAPINLPALIHQSIVDTNKVLAEARRPRIPKGYSPPHYLLYDAEQEFPGKSVEYYSGAAVQKVHRPFAAVQRSTGVTPAMTVVSNGITGDCAAVASMHNIQRQEAARVPIVTEDNTTTTCGLLQNFVRQHEAVGVGIALGHGLVVQDPKPSLFSRLFPKSSSVTEKGAELTRNLLGEHRLRNVGRRTEISNPMPIDNAMVACHNGAPHGPTHIVPPPPPYNEDFHHPPAGTLSPTNTMESSQSSGSGAPSGTQTTSPGALQSAGSSSAPCPLAPPSTSQGATFSTRSLAQGLESFAQDHLTPTCQTFLTTGLKQLHSSAGSSLNFMAQSTKSLQHHLRSGLQDFKARIAKISLMQRLGSTSTTTTTSSSSPTSSASSASARSGAPSVGHSIESPSSQGASSQSPPSTSASTGHTCMLTHTTSTPSQAERCSTSVGQLLRRSPISSVTTSAGLGKQCISKLTSLKMTCARTLHRLASHLESSSDSACLDSHLRPFTSSSYLSGTDPEEASEQKCRPDLQLELRTPLLPTLLPISPCSLKAADAPVCTAGSSRSWSEATICLPGSHPSITTPSSPPIEQPDSSQKLNPVTESRIADSVATPSIPASLSPASMESSLTIQPQLLSAGSRCSAQCQTSPSAIGQPTSEAFALASETKSNMSQSCQTSSTLSSSNQSTSSPDTIESPTLPSERQDSSTCLPPLSPL